MTCPFFKGVCTYTVAARPETTVVVAVTAPVQAVVTVVNDTVAGADWTGTTMEDDKEDVVDEAEELEGVDATEEDDLVDKDEATEADEVDEVLEATEEEEDDEDEDELDDADEETALEEEATLDEDRGGTLATIDGRDVGRETTLDDEAATAGQLLGFELMLSATLVRLK
jgi:hypothetical protein